MPDRALFDQLDQAIDLMLRGDAQADPALAELMEIAGALKNFPSESFKTRLSEELQRSPHMTASTSAPAAAIHAVTPFITVPEGDQLIEFMKQTFDAEETARTDHGPDGFVASVRIGDSNLLVMGGESVRGQARPAALHVYVKDTDAVYRRAIEAGAITTPRASASPPIAPTASVPRSSPIPPATSGTSPRNPGPTMLPKGWDTLRRTCIPRRPAR